MPRSVGEVADWEGRRAELLRVGAEVDRLEHESRQRIVESVAAGEGPRAVEVFEFDPNDVEWPGIGDQTSYRILEARRVDGTLMLRVRRFYDDGCDISSWNTGEYIAIGGAL